MTLSVPEKLFQTKIFLEGFHVTRTNSYLKESVYMPIFNMIIVIESTFLSVFKCLTYMCFGIFSDNRSYLNYAAKK